MDRAVDTKAEIPNVARETTADTGSPPRVSDQTIGAGIRRERLRQSLTLAVVSERTNLTVSALSQFERGKAEPSIGSLRRIASALGVPLFQFLISEPRPQIVVRGATRSKIVFPGRELEYELVTPDTHGDFEVLSIVLRPGGATGPTPGTHASEECLVVLRGSVVVDIVGARYRLGAGDSIRIHRNLPHRISNESARKAELLMVISPPTF